MNGGAPFTPPRRPTRCARTSATTTIEFLFAQFVDMHGKPNAKLVPARHFDDLLDDGAGFAGFAAGDIGQRPNDPDMAAMPDVRSFTPLPWRPGVARFACDVHVEGEEWPYCPRTILRRQLDRARGARLRVQDRRRARVLPRAQAARTARSSSPTRSTRSTSPVTTCARSRATSTSCRRSRSNVTGARLGQLRHRPRGRQRPVRAELRVRRRADHLRPRDLLPLHGRVDGAGARADRHLHAEAVRPPHRQRLPLPHEPVEGRRERLRGATPADDPRGMGLSRDRLQLHRRAEDAREGVHRAHRADGHVVQAPGDRARAAARAWAPVYISYGFNNRTQMLRIPAAGPDRGPHRRRLVQPLPGRDRGARRRASTASRTGLDAGEPTTELNLHELDRGRAQRSSASSCCRPTCWTPRASSSRTTCCAPRSATPGARTTSTTSSKIKQREFAECARADHAVGARPLPAAVLGPAPLIHPRAVPARTRGGCAISRRASSAATR